MVDRDPVTEPAGDMAAAQKLVETLVWIDEGGEDRFYMLADVLLGWKGKRLRDAIADTGVVHLGKRQTDITPQTDPDFLSRLARAAGLVLSGPALETFIRSWLEMSPEDAPFRLERLRALGGLIHIVVRRKERELAAVSLTLLKSRDELPPLEPPPHATGAARRVDIDGHLAEHLYRQHARQDPALAEELRRWLCDHAHYVNPSKHRVLREAALLSHWDVIEAFFQDGHPFGKSERSSLKLPAGAQTGDLRTKISEHLVEHLAAEDAPTLNAVTRACGRHIIKGSGDIGAMMEWLLALADLADKGRQPARDAIDLLHPIHDRLRALREDDNDDIRDAAAELCGRLEAQWEDT